MHDRTDQPNLVEQIKMIGSHLSTGTPTLLASSDNLTEAFKDLGKPVNVDLAGAILTAHQILVSEPDGTMLGTLAGIDSWPADWDAVGNADPIPSTEAPVEPALPTLAELVPLIPSKMRGEALSVAAEVNAIVENMRAVLNRGAELHAEASLFSEHLNRAFLAEFSNLPVNERDGAMWFFDAMTGAGPLGSALLELRDLVDIG